MHDHLDIDESIFFVVRSWTSTRDHQFKLFKPPAVREVRQKILFSTCCIELEDLRLCWMICIKTSFIS